MGGTVIERPHDVAGGGEEAARRRANYAERRDDASSRHDALRRRWNVVGNARLAAFVLVVVVAFVGLQFGDRWPFAVAGLLLLAFVFLVVHHRRLGGERRRAAALHDINREALHRADRSWRELPLRHSVGAEPGHPFAGDLDLFGRASLFHLLETVETPMGAERLRSWLTDPAPPEVVRERQGAAAELVPELEWRQELAVRGRLIGEERPDPEPLLSWAEGDRWLAHRRALRVAALLGPLAVAASAVLAIAGVLPWAVVITFGLLNIVLTQVLAPEARARINLVAGHYRSISQQATLLEHIERFQGASEAFQDVARRLTTEGHRASELLGDLGKRAAFAVPPGTILYLPLQALVAWDLNVLARLETWQATAGGQVRTWLKTIGDVEALAALAGLAYDEPGWVFPELDSESVRFDAVGLGHPLLRDDERIVNNVEIGPPGTFLFVTGSNMSGKSTLLRAIGVNLVLAGAGGPVCATSLSTPPVRLWTSVRVEDSLERGVSFFMAELQRLKQVVDAATNPAPSEDRLFYLLDEILQGTNTAERQIAARRVIRRLIDKGAIGAVSTHDLTLADGPELAGAARPVHLRDAITPAGMSFDYKLRPGVATSTNALRLMDIVFGERDEQSPPIPPPLPPDDRGEGAYGR